VKILPFFKHQNQIKMKNIAIQIMNIEQMIDDEVNAEGAQLTNEEMETLYSDLHKMETLYFELQKLQMLRHGDLQDIEVEIHNNTKFKIKK